jgi:hypothetical protein
MSTSQLVSDTKLQRQINDFLTEEEKKYNAATRIQAHYGGFFTRRKLQIASEIAKDTVYTIN